MNKKNTLTLSLLLTLTATTALADALQDAYQAAIKDASVAEADEISHDLTAIVPGNTALTWKGEGAEQRVLMATWTNWNGYDTKVGQAVPLTREIWTTAVPQLRTFCQHFAQGQEATAVALRLEQLLGLPPHNGKTRFVEMWVNPADLFRPSPDSEVTDKEAQLDFPTGTPETHVAWITNLKNTSYGSNGYPWTALGYTYDWGNPASEVGLSEFVIRPGATVEVQAVHLNEEYCRNSAN